MHMVYLIEGRIQAKFFIHTMIYTYNSLVTIFVVGTLVQNRNPVLITRVIEEM